MKRLARKIWAIGLAFLIYGNLYAATETLNPDSVGSKDSLTSSSAGDNYLMVNDDDTTTFVHTASTTFRRDLYDLSTYAGSGTISQIEVFAKAMNIDGSPPPNNLKICIQPGGDGTIYESGTISTLGNGVYAEYSNIWLTNPDDGDWQWSDIPDLQAGISLKGAFFENTRCAEVWVVITYTQDPPAAPHNCSATDDLCDSIIITWTDTLTNETGFKIYRDAAYLDSIKSADVTEYVDNPSAGSHNYYVTAYNAGGESDTSNHYDGERFTTPAVPANCQATDGVHANIIITWNVVTGATGYNIYRGGVYLDFVLAPTLTYTDITAASGTIYSYQVTAYTTHAGPGVTCESALSTADDGIRPTKYYVRKPPNGDDTHNGTNSATEAWATIQKAADNMTIPGDIVYVGAGTYAEEVNPGYPGNATDLISYIADPTGIYMDEDSGDVVFIATPGMGDNGFLFTDGNAADYVKIDGFEINAGGIDNGIDVRNRTGIVISNNNIHGNTWGIHGTGSNLTIFNDSIYSNTVGIYLLGSGSTVTNNFICSNVADGIAAGNSANLTISNNSIYSNEIDGISNPGAGSEISNNSIYSNDVTGIYVNGNDNLIIKNNLIYFNGNDGIGGSAVGGPGSGSIISNNTLYHEILAKSSAKSLANEVKVEYDDGIVVTETGVTIKNNIIVNYEYGIYCYKLLPEHPDANPTISYNDVWNNTIANYYGCSAGEGDINPPRDPKFVNDTIASPDLHIKSDNASCHGGVWGANPSEGSWIADDEFGDPNCSPCVDAGDAADDEGDEPEENGNRINMGCFGGTAQASLECFVSAVELVSFDARPEKDYILLNWITEAEIDNDKWLIKRAENKDADYKQIIKLHAQGFPNNYIYIDSLITPGRAYWYKLGDVDKCGKTTWHGPVLAKASPNIKFSFFLKEPAANPSTGKVRLEYSVSGYQGDNQRPITLKIYNVSGQIIKTLVNERQKPGHYTIWWDGKNNRSKKVGSGTYFCHFKANGESTRKLIRIK